MKKAFYNFSSYGLCIGLASLIPDLDGNLFLPLWASIPMIIIFGVAEKRLR